VTKTGGHDKSIDFLVKFTKFALFDKTKMEFLVVKSFGACLSLQALNFRWRKN